MNCQEFEENLPLLLYEELSAEEQAACEEHLVGVRQLPGGAREDRATPPSAG